MKTELCPVCKGRGTYGKRHRRCHGCDGDGWVLVPVDDERPAGAVDVSSAEACPVYGDDVTVSTIVPYWTAVWPGPRFRIAQITIKAQQ